MCIRLRPEGKQLCRAECELLECSDCSGGTARRVHKIRCKMQASPTSKHSEALIRLPATPVASKSRVRALCSLVSYWTLTGTPLVSSVENDAIRATRKPRPKQDYLNQRQEPSPRALHSTMTNKLDYSNQIFHSLGSMSDSDEERGPASCPSRRAVEA